MADENNIKGKEATEENNGAETNFDELLKDVDLEKLLEHESVKKLVQKQSDRRVSQALETAKAKWKQAQEQENTEAEKLKKMTEEQREKYNLEKEKSSFEKEKQQFEHEKLVVEVKKQMLEAGLPDLSNFITANTAEETTSNIEVITERLNAWKQEQLKSAMRGTPPRDTNPKDKTSKLTASDIKKMTPAEINEAWKAGRIDTKNL